jgi:TolB-like protein/Tfp pilus assembly protein PilF
VVFAAIVMGIWLLFLKGKESHPQNQVPSIAILPFEDLSPLNDQAHICEGMTSEIITKLSRLGKFDVRSRFLVKSFAGTEKSLKTIGEELSVDNILFGSILFEKENVRVDVELLRVLDSRTLWTDSYPRKSNELFSIQREIAEEIANSLKMTLTPEEKAGLQKKYTDNIEAYNFYLRGRWFYDKRSDEGFENAIEYFQKAIDLDPNYALAYSGLANVYMSMSESSLDKAAEKAREAARKSMDLDDSLAEAYTSQASVRGGLDWDFKRAEEDYKKAIKLNPDYDTAHHWYSRLLTMLGRHEEAISEMERALELNPNDLTINRNFVVTLLCARQPDRALAQAKRTYEMNPNFFQVKELLFLALFTKSMFQEILELYKDDEESLYVWTVNLLIVAKNNRDEAVKILDEYADISPSFWAAWLYSMLGEEDKFFKHLEWLYENRHWRLTFIKAWPGFEKYHSDPRFKDLIKRMNLD